MQRTHGLRLRYVDSAGRFDIPLDTGAETALEVGLGHIEEGVDRVLLATGGEEDHGLSEMRADMTLAEKVGLLFADTGYGDDPEDHDRDIWPDIIELDELRRQGCTENVEELAARWLDESGWPGSEDIPGFPDRSSPLYSGMRLALILNGFCAYVDGWIEGFFGPEKQIK